MSLKSFSVYHFITIVIIALSTTLLIGARFEARWAGGAGYETHQSAFVLDQEFVRGEVIASGDDWLIVEFGPSLIWLYADSELLIVDGREGQLSVNLLQGRAVIDGHLQVQARELMAKIDGVAAIVHYSWLDELELADLEGSLWLEYDDESIDISNQARRYSTLPPYDYAEFDFDPENSEAADFYHWAIQ